MGSTDEVFRTPQFGQFARHRSSNVNLFPSIFTPSVSCDSFPHLGYHVLVTYIPRLLYRSLQVAVFLLERTAGGFSARTTIAQLVIHVSERTDAGHMILLAALQVMETSPQTHGSQEIWTCGTQCIRCMLPSRRSRWATFAVVFHAVLCSHRHHLYGRENRVSHQTMKYMADPRQLAAFIARTRL